MARNLSAAEAADLAKLNADMGADITPAEHAEYLDSSAAALAAGYKEGTLAFTVVQGYLAHGGALGDHELYLALGQL